MADLFDFSRRSKARNVTFIIAFYLGVWFMTTYAFMEHRFVYLAPLIIVFALVALLVKPPHYFLPFAVGVLLQYGLFSALMQYLTIGANSGTYLQLLIGTIGAYLVFTSIWQAVLGSWKMPGWYDVFLKILLILGIAYVLFISGLAIHLGIKPNFSKEKPTPYRTY